MSQETFAALGVSAGLAAALEARGITTPFQIQTRAIPPALAGTDLLAKSPTGSGKTLAFAIPLVERVPLDDARPAALVLVPTRELALQVTEEIAFLAKARGVKVATVYGGVSLRPQANLAETRTWSSRRPGACRICSTGGSSPSTPSSSSSSTRPTECSTWGSSRRSTGS